MRTYVTDYATAVGIIVALSLIVIAISLGGSIYAFIDIKSILIVVAGTFFLTTACFTFSEMISAQGLVFKSIYYESEDPKRMAVECLKLADTSRKKGSLALNQYEGYKSMHPFLKRGLNLVIDGIPQAESIEIMEAERAATLLRHRKSVAILQKAAEISPAMGLIGTLIGLVQMLGNLSDPSSIGPAMAVALLTTLYGAALAFIVFNPLASKLERNSVKESLIMDMFIQTILSISKKENPRRLEILINAQLPRGSRVKYFS